ncbi:MAG: chromosomal replication initiator protein DnaA [Firmicutes bacterium]|nr:chromosomal replication initiator protein DnaA [Bacillota bacterium]
MNDFELKWRDILSVVKKTVNNVSYDTWFSPIKVNKIDDDPGIIYLSIEDDFSLGILKTRYMSVLESAVEDVLGKRYSVIINLGGEKEEKTDESSNIYGAANESDSFTSEFILDPNNSFENFIVGDNNRFAHAAALAVAENPSDAYNPLFLYGGPGLGKTHLMHAIGHYVLKNHPSLKVLYISSEMFTNEFIKALDSKKKKGGMEAFRKKYRGIDVLLIDDIQFIQGKESTETEFFNTFNRLYESNKQIILSSDRAPNEMKVLDERLRSRFQWNLVADIQPPEFETRIAILRNRANIENIALTHEVDAVIELIAEKIKFNIRDLVGAFTRVASFSKIMNEKIDLKFAKKILKDVIKSGDFNVSCETIKKKVCKKYGIKITDIESKKRTRDLTVPRQVAMYLCKELTDTSYPKIGDAFGGRDHSTVVYAYEKISSEIKTNSALADDIEDLRNMIDNG